MIKNRSLYQKVEDYVGELFKRTGKTLLATHSRRTVYWLLQLEPDADEGLQIAALAHDIERAVPDPYLSSMIATSPKGYMNPLFLREHSERGADIVADFLAREGAAPDFIERVRLLVAGHEFSGSDDQNVIKNADSLSFFENYIELFTGRKKQLYGYDKVKAKFDWMFHRITSQKARRLAIPLYHRALSDLKSTNI